MVLAVLHMLCLVSSKQPTKEPKQRPAEENEAEIDGMLGLVPIDAHRAAAFQMFEKRQRVGAFKLPIDGDIASRLMHEPGASCSSRNQASQGQEATREALGISKDVDSLLLQICDLKVVARLFRKRNQQF